MDLCALAENELAILGSSNGSGGPEVHPAFSIFAHVDLGHDSSSISRVRPPRQLPMTNLAGTTASCRCMLNRRGWPAGVDRRSGLPRMRIPYYSCVLARPKKFADDLTIKDARTISQKIGIAAACRRSAGNDRRTHRKPGVTTEELDRICHGLYPSTSRRRIPPAELQGLSQVRSAPRINHCLPLHPQRMKPLEGRRHPQRRHHRHQGRLPRDDQQDVPASRKTPEWPDRAWPAHPGMHVQGHFLVRPETARNSGRYRRNHPEARAKRNGLGGGPRILGPCIGKVFHEEPQSSTTVVRATASELKEALIFTIEPMINQGRPETRLPRRPADRVSPRTASCPANGSNRAGSPPMATKILTLRNDETCPAPPRQPDSGPRLLPGRCASTPRPIPRADAPIRANAAHPIQAPKKRTKTGRSRIEPTASR
ncbi:hypothetical protein FQR65_LT20584 [Abscondita terminalis]|nr:hypothetical protein FQR65_LT20584 [Abscondita terminalis]